MSTESEQATAISADAEAAKTNGNEHYKGKRYREAVDAYTQAIELGGPAHILYSNRSAAYSALHDYDNALKDAKTVTEMKPQWSKGWGRVGLAHVGLKDYDAAIEAYKHGLTLDGDNLDLSKGLLNAEGLKDPTLGLARRLLNPRVAPNVNTLVSSANPALLDAWKRVLEDSATMPDETLAYVQTKLIPMIQDLVNDSPIPDDARGVLSNMCLSAADILAAKRVSKDTHPEEWARAMAMKAEALCSLAKNKDAAEAARAGLEAIERSKNEQLWSLLTLCEAMALTQDSMETQDIALARKGLEMFDTIIAVPKLPEKIKQKAYLSKACTFQSFLAGEVGNLEDNCHIAATSLYEASRNLNIHQEMQEYAQLILAAAALHGEAARLRTDDDLKRDDVASAVMCYDKLLMMIPQNDAAARAEIGLGRAGSLLLHPGEKDVRPIENAAAIKARVKEAQTAADEAEAAFGSANIKMAEIEMLRAQACTTLGDAARSGTAEAKTKAASQAVMHFDKAIKALDDFLQSESGDDPAVAAAAGGQAGLIALRAVLLESRGNAVLNASQVNDTNLDIETRRKEFLSGYEQALSVYEAAQQQALRRARMCIKRAEFELCAAAAENASWDWDALLEKVNTALKQPQQVPSWLGRCNLQSVLTDVQNGAKLWRQEWGLEQERADVLRMGVQLAHMQAVQSNTVAAETPRLALAYKDAAAMTLPVTLQSTKHQLSCFVGSFSLALASADDASASTAQVVDALVTALSFKDQATSAMERLQKMPGVQEAEADKCIQSLKPLITAAESRLPALRSKAQSEEESRERKLRYLTLGVAVVAVGAFVAWRRRN